MYFFYYFHVSLCSCMFIGVWAHMHRRVHILRPKIDIRNYPGGSPILLNEAGSC